MDQAPWQPLLSGSDRSHALERVREIADALKEQLEQHDYPALAGGLGGFSLFYSYCDAVFDDRGYGELASQLLQRTVTQAAAGGLAVGLFGGYAGIGWLCDHVGVNEDGSDANAPFDRLILDGLASWEGEYDLINGLVGLGVYGLERAGLGAGPAIVARVVELLASAAVRIDGGRTWFTPAERLVPWQRERYPSGYYNLGLAHGVPGIASLLVRVEQVGHTQLGSLIDDCLAWIAAQARSGADAQYPAVALTSHREPPTRSGWCYGDPGIAAMFVSAGLRRRQARWIDLGVELARGVAVRSAEDAGCGDAGLCHGSAGLGHILNRIFQATGDEEVAAGARRWIGLALAQRDEGGIAGYREAEPMAGELHWEESAGLLTGAAGTGLALLAAASDVHPDWDRLLLLDVA